MAVKLFYALRQKSDISTAEFQKIWKEKYGPLVASLQTTLKISKYIQIHRWPGDVDTILREARTLLWKPDVPPFDIVDEYYFDMSLDEFVSNFAALQEAWKPLITLESSIIDPAGSQISFVTEHPQVMPGAQDNIIASPWNHLLRIHVFAEMRDEAAFEHWENDHADVVRRWSHASGGLKYVQNHPRLNSKNAAVLDALRKERGIDGSSVYTWYASAWLGDDVLSRQNPMSATAGKEINDDEELGWMKPKSMNYFLAKEFIFVDKYRV